MEREDCRADCRREWFPPWSFLSHRSDISCPPVLENPGYYLLVGVLDNGGVKCRIRFF